MTAGDSHAELSSPWLTRSGSFLKDSDTESYLSLTLWPARLFQYKTFILLKIHSSFAVCILPARPLSKDHIRFIITCCSCEVSNSGIVPCPPVPQHLFPPQYKQCGMKKRGDCLGNAGRLVDPGYQSPTRTVQVSHRKVIYEPKTETLTSAGCKHV